MAVRKLQICIVVYRSHHGCLSRLISLVVIRFVHIFMRDIFTRILYTQFIEYKFNYIYIYIT